MHLAEVEKKGEQQSLGFNDDYDLIEIIVDAVDALSDMVPVCHGCALFSSRAGRDRKKHANAPGITINSRNEKIAKATVPPTPADSRIAAGLVFTG